MKKYSILIFGLLCFFSTAVGAQTHTPGKHTVVLTWTPGACGGAAGTCTTNVYRAAVSPVCPAGVPIIPLVTGVAGSTYTDPNPPNGAVFYNVTNVDPSKGGESTCDGEVQVTVQPITTSPDSTLAATVQ